MTRARPPVDAGAAEMIPPMRLFIDTGSVAEVEEIAAWGVLSGATTNPSLLAREEGAPGRQSGVSANWCPGRYRPRSSATIRRRWSRRDAHLRDCTSR